MSITTFNIGGIQYISYASLAEADAYIINGDPRYTAWNAATDETKMSRLILGSRLVDAAGRFTGEKEDETQEEAWPRTGATRYGESVPDGLPNDIEVAAILLAGTILTNPNAIAITTRTASAGRVKKLEGGGASIEYFDDQSATPASTVELVAPDQEADKLIRPYLTGLIRAEGGGRSGQGFAFGTGAQGSFNDRDRFRINP